MSVAISPAHSSVAAGLSKAYSATASDVYGNTWDVTSSTSWSISSGAGGSWSGNVYTSANVGLWTVTGTYASKVYATSLTVVAGAVLHVDHFVFSSVGSQVAGTSFPITVTAVDASGATVTSYSGTPTLTYSAGSISPSSATGGFTAGVWSGLVMVTVAGSGVTITATDGSARLERVAPFTVTHASAVSSLTVSVSPSSVAAGGVVTGSATAYDVYGNSWDVSVLASWGIPAGGDGGFWSSNVYTSHTAGTYTVQGAY